MTAHLSDDTYIKNRIMTIQRPELDHPKTGFMTIKPKTHIIKNVTPYYCCQRAGPGTRPAGRSL